MSGLCVLTLSQVPCPQEIQSLHRFKLINDQCPRVLFPSPESPSDPAFCLVSPENTPVSALVEVCRATFLKVPELSMFPGIVCPHGFVQSSEQCCAGVNVSRGMRLEAESWELIVKHPLYRVMGEAGKMTW